MNLFQLETNNTKIKNKKPRNSPRIMGALETLPWLRSAETSDFPKV